MNNAVAHSLFLALDQTKLPKVGVRLVEARECKDFTGRKKAGYSVRIDRSLWVFVDTINNRVVDSYNDLVRLDVEADENHPTVLVKVRSRIFRGLLTRYLWKMRNDLDMDHTFPDSILHKPVLIEVKNGHTDDCSSSKQSAGSHVTVTEVTIEENSSGDIDFDDSGSDVDDLADKQSSSNYLTLFGLTPVLTKTFNGHTTVVVCHNGLDGSKRSREVYQVYSDNRKPRALKASDGNRKSVRELEIAGWKTSVLKDCPSLFQYLADAVELLLPE